MTYLARACPCCDSTRYDAYPALVSPFVASYAMGTKPSPTRLLECDACGFRFFEDRLTDAEAERLYTGYRGDRYYQERHRHEPWYTRKVNDGIGGSDDVIRVRRAMVERFLRDRIDVTNVKDVLDFGGDRGQLIPEGIGQQRFFYEISGIDSVSGVTRIGSAGELRERRFDLVLLSHVLEHCSEPATVLAEVHPVLRSKDSVLYIELPFERANLRWLGRKGAYRSYLGALRRVKPLLTAVDLYSTLFRIRFDSLPPLGFVKLHEHINFFDERSLEKLLEHCGFEAIALERLVIRSSLGSTPVLSALARTR
jgi:SAM-dependent methyltransferase